MRGRRTECSKSECTAASVKQVAQDPLSMRSMPLLWKPFSIFNQYICMNEPTLGVMCCVAGRGVVLRPSVALIA